MIINEKNISQMQPSIRVIDSIDIDWLQSSCRYRVHSLFDRDLIGSTYRTALNKFIIIINFKNFSLLRISSTAPCHFQNDISSENIMY